MKATMLLAIAIFLVAAPAPDAATIAEFTAQFIVLDQPETLQAAEAQRPDFLPAEPAAPAEAETPADLPEGA